MYQPNVDGLPVGAGDQKKFRQGELERRVHLRLREQYCKGIVKPWVLRRALPHGDGERHVFPPLADRNLESFGIIEVAVRHRVRQVKYRLSAPSPRGVNHRLRYPEARRPPLTSHDERHESRVAALSAGLVEFVQCQRRIANRRSIT